MGKVMLLALTCLMSFGNINQGDLDQFKKNVAGEHRLLSADGDVRTSGFVKISLNAQEMVIDISSYDSSGPQGANIIKFPFAKSDLKLGRDAYAWDYKDVGEVHSSADFKMSTGYFEVEWTRCDDKGCTPGRFSATQGESNGVKLDTADFFKKLKGSYGIDGTTESVTVNVQDAKEAVLTVNKNAVRFSYDKTKVYAVKFPTGETLYVILRQEAKGFSLFHWEDRAQKVAYRDYQPAQGAQCVEYIVSK